MPQHRDIDRVREDCTVLVRWHNQVLREQIDVAEASRQEANGLAPALARHDNFYDRALESTNIPKHSMLDIYNKTSLMHCVVEDRS